MAAKQAKAVPEPNSRGLVVLKHKETGAVQEFVPESVPTWQASGWEEADQKAVDEAAESGLISTPVITDKEN